MKHILFSTAIIASLSLTSCCKQEEKCEAPTATQRTEQVAPVETTIERIEQGTHISQASKAGNLVFLSGQIGDGKTITEQAQNVFKTIDGLLTKAGTDKSKIIFATVYLTDMNDYGEFNDAWIKWLGNSSKPSRATVQVVQLAKPEWKVEVQVSANL
ncbi:RidA family protein [Echinicola soli]|uniref:RidA family protein n=2 Tax=Echinicola soli TaxID=2591634 RepID=A0A514CNV7_9BACT|nr:RidA family protein [Echinicola soli]